MSDTQRLPNLYQLLGLNGLENNPEKISVAVKRAQTKLDSLKADPARASDAARLQKVIALCQKYLLSPELKANYDAQWRAVYASNTTTSDASTTNTANTANTATTEIEPAAKQPAARAVAAAPKPVAAATAVAAKSAAVATSSTNELSWDMSSLEALLPPADPHAPFQMAEYLRTSQVRDPLAAEADLRKLISLLGGELSPTSEPGASQSISLQHMSAGEAMLGSQLPAEQNLWNGAIDQQASSTDTGVSMPRSTGTPAAAAALAKRMRQKRQRAMLMGGTLLTAALGGLALLGLYLNRPVTKAAPPVAQLPAVPPAPVPSMNPGEPAGGNQPENTTVVQPVPNPNSTLLIQPGENVKPLEIQATPLTKPDAMAMPDKPALEPMKPEPQPEPAKPQPTPEPPKPEPPKPEPAKPEPPKSEPAKPEDTKPEAAKPAEPPADVKLTDKEKKSWQDDMKRVRAGLNKLDPATSEQQIESLKSIAKTSGQRQQLETLEQAVGLIRKAREALVAGIGGLESAQTFTVGSSTEVSFVEGDETRLIVRLSGRRQEYKLEAIPAAMAVILMKMKPNVVDANLEAAMGAYIMVQAKKNNAATAQGKKFLEDAAGAGAISKELAQFYAEDYKL